MFRHVVMFTWTVDATDAAKAAVSAGLARLPEEIDTIRAYRFGPDAGVNEGNHDFVVVADFDDVAGYLIYRDHRAHRRLIDEHIAPILATRAAVQYDTD